MLPRRISRMPPSNRRLTAEHHRALRLLAETADGCTEAILLAHGFQPRLIVELVDTGLAIATAERLLAGGRPVEVTRVRITEIGRQKLTERR
jgi:hypothetical protein